MIWVCAAFLPIAVFGTMIWQQRWMSDDGFINLRVVHNLLAGHGPVFNIGERAEAYTSTLWLGIISLFTALGIRPERVATWGGLALSLVGALSATYGAAKLHAWNQSAHLGTPLRRGLSVFEGMLPLGLITYIVLPPAWDYGTSGLETGLSLAWLGLSFLMLTSLAIGDLGESLRKERYFYGVGAFLGLAPLIRPDLALFSFGFLLPLLMMLFARKRGGFRFSKLVSMGVAMAALPVAYQVFRMGYFAAIVPNTAFAKEAFESRWTQGGHFFNDFFIRYRLLLPLGGLGLLWLAALRRAGMQALGAPNSRQRDRAEARLRLCLLAIPALCGLAHCLYVVKIGGGFMHGRLFLPGVFGMILPMASAPIWTSKPRQWGWWPGRVMLTLGLLAWAGYCGLTLRIQVENQHGIGDERGWYARQAKVKNPVLLDDYREMYFQKSARKLRRIAHASCPSAFGEKSGFFDTVAQSKSLGSGWTPPDSCTPTVYAKKVKSTAFGRLFPSQRVFDVAPHYIDRGIAQVSMHTGLGMRSLVMGPQAYIVDRVGLSSPISSRLELSRRGRPGHEKALPTPWMIGRFSPPVSGEDPRVSAARQALECGALGDLVEATNAPMSASRFLKNIEDALRFHKLRIPNDSFEAVERFCGIAPPARVIAGGTGGKPQEWRCPSGYALSGFDARIKTSENALASLRPDCRPIDNAMEVEAGSPARLEGKRADTPTFGGKSRSRSRALRCPQHRAVVGLRGASLKFVEELTPICQETDTAPSPETPTGGRASADATPFELRCPANTVATGMTVRAGALIDAVGLLCETP